MARPPKTLEERFWKFVDRKGKNDCWEWLGYKHSKRWRYGKIDDRKGSSGTHAVHFAHRLSYQMAYGPIDESLCVCHKCDNPPCVNPSHLFLGTHTENHADAVTKGRHAHGELSKRKLRECDVLNIRKDSRLYRIIAKDFGVSDITICDIKTKRTWKHLP